MKQKPKTLVAALESFGDADSGLPINDQNALMTTQPENPDPDNHDVVQLEPQLGLEELEAELDIREKEKHCGNLDIEISEAVASVDRLERLQELSKRVSDQEGGLTRTSGEALSAALEAIVGNVGIPMAETNYPALENFGGVKSRLEGTKMAMESFSENIKNILKHVWEALMATAKKIMEMYEAVAGQSAIVKRRAAAIRRQAEGTTGSPNAKSFENASLAARLSVEGVVPTRMVQEINRVAKLGEDIFSFNAKHNGSDFIKFFIGVTSDAARFKDVAELFMTPSVNGLKKTNGPTRDTVSFESDILPGNYQARLTVIDREPTEDVLIDALSEVGGEVSYVELSRTQRGELPILTVPDSIVLLKAVEDMMDRVAAFRKDVQEFKKNREALAEAGRKFTDKAAKESEEGDHDRLRGLATGMHAANRMIGQPGIAYARYMTLFSRSILAYVEASLRTYERKEDK